MTKLNHEIKSRIRSSFEFISGNNLNETELQAELTGLALFTIDNFKSSLADVNPEESNIYYRKQPENNYEK